MTKKTTVKKDTKETKSKKSKDEVKEETVKEETELVEELLEEADVDGDTLESTQVNISKSESLDSLSDQKDEKTNETVDESFDNIIKLIDSEIENIRNGQSKIVGVKFLRSMNKKIKLLKAKTSKFVKQKSKGTRKTNNNTNSGFLKPVKISKEMGKFTGWGVSDLHSRVDVTKYICKYIKDNNLQNPSDRRQIIADNKLSKLLNYDSSKDDKPLTYYRIQSYIKPHFIPADVQVA
jgi:chromatin remodeling complex protein RSC6